MKYLCNRWLVVGCLTCLFHCKNVLRYSTFIWMICFMNRQFNKRLFHKWIYISSIPLFFMWCNYLNCCHTPIWHSSNPPSLFTCESTWIYDWIRSHSIFREPLHWIGARDIIEHTPLAQPFGYLPARRWGENITPLPEFCDNSRTALVIDTKLAVPSCASIWHMLWKFWRNSSENCGKMTVLWRHYTRFSRKIRPIFKRPHLLQLSSNFRL